MRETGAYDLTESFHRLDAKILPFLPQERNLQTHHVSGLWRSDTRSVAEIRCGDRASLSRLDLSAMRAKDAYLLVTSLSIAQLSRAA